MLKYNPFRPGSIVTPGMFAGRGEELLQLEKILFQTKNGNSLHFLIDGERGIGKSSLIFFIECISKGEIESFNCGYFNFLTVSLLLDPADSYIDIIKKIIQQIEVELRNNKNFINIAKDVWDFLKKWEILGVRYHESEESQLPHEMLNKLVEITDCIIKKSDSTIDGVLILIDEADNAPNSAHIGEFVKLYTERLTKIHCNNVAVGLSGLPTLIRKLKSSHQSAPRIFEIIHLDPLLKNEQYEVIYKGLAIANEKNNNEVTITEDAKNIISWYSEGYPHFLQQFSYSSFENDNDNNITVDDVFEGSSHALTQLGLKYFGDWYFSKIGSDEYRSVLRIMSSHMTRYVSKGEIRKAAELKESTLNNAISALKTRNIIMPHPSKKGYYKLPSRSFAVWIRAMTRAATKPSKNKKATK